MPRLPRKPPPRSRTSSRGGGRRTGPPGPGDLIRFARSLWPDEGEDRARCEALIEATIDTIQIVRDDELRRVCLRRLLERAYEGLKEP